MRIGLLEISKGEPPRFLTRVIRSSIRSVMLYTIAAFVMIWVTGNPPPDALTIAYFGYWSFENGAAALIRIKEKREEEEKGKKEVKTDELERP